MKQNSSKKKNALAFKLACLLTAATAFNGCELDTAYIDAYEDVIGADGVDCENIQRIALTDSIILTCLPDDSGYCTKEGIVANQNGEQINASKYQRYYVSFLDHKCPAYLTCENGNEGNFCTVKNCKGDTHEYNGSCEDNSVEHCGKHESCEMQVDGWVNGDCKEGVCIVSECSGAAKPSANGKSCVSDCSAGQHYDSSTQKCENDNKDNCGGIGNKCNTAAGWVEGDCILGKCSASQCEIGYDLVLSETVYDIENNRFDINKCKKGDCPAGQHSDKGECVGDDVSNCGQTGFDCSKNVANWVAGDCLSGVCYVSDCSGSFKPSKDGPENEDGEINSGTMCIPDCGEGQHYDNATSKCAADDIDNCGQTGYSCTTTSGWVKGGCVNGVCVAEECDSANGYTPVNGKCIAACIGNQVKCGDLCRDPLQDSKYCGATGTINSCTSVGVECKKGEVCIDGKCQTNSCTNSSETLCSTTSGNTCINIKSSDANNCGSCGYKCSEHAIQNATSTTCSAGNCQYTCASGYVNVGSGSTSANIKCIDPKTDSSYCGATSSTAKGKVCTTGTVCIDGNCLTNSCTNASETLCSSTSGNRCINIKSTDANNCGACGYRCSEHAIPNATSTTCSAGNCQYTCASGYVNVGSGSTSTNIKCIDPKTDSSYCGATSSTAKGKVCTTGTVCIDGNCATNSCTNASETLCSSTSGNTCINIKSSDTNNCGACGYKCSEHAIQNATSNTCNSGNCQYTCASGYVNVGSGSTSANIKCIDPKTDSSYCGATSSTAKGTVCSTGKVCIDGKCQTNSCTNSSETLCATTSGNTCINLNSSDANNCGACGYKCSEHAIQNATSTICSAGNCQYTCASGYINVGSGSTSANIKCIDPKTDSSYCGATSSSSKGTVCSTGTVCIDGKCATNSCTNSSQTLCSTTSGNTCINLNSSDANNCGACGYRCSEHAIQNATSNTCSSGNCQYTCASGYINVGSGSTSANIKCIDPKTDSSYCGATSSTAKGKVCTTGTVCIDGYCATNSCTNSSQTLCSTTSGNTCINLKSTDANNCGACGYKCSEHAIQNATSNTCSSGNCQYTCASGYVNVGSGSTSTNIKCIDPKTDSSYCGATSSYSKGTVCSTGKVCIDGKCQTNSCTNSSETLCATTSGNTCINLKSTDANNCGTCGYKCSEHAIQNATSNTCSSGNCQYTCASGYVNVGSGNTSANIKCIDPKTDSSYCGATSSYSKGTVCSTGKVCIDGKCTINSCTNSSETLCSTTSGNTCINLKSTDANNCGACGYKCSEHPLKNAKSSTCSSGQCSYKCNDGYVQLGTSTTADSIECIPYSSLNVNILTLANTSAVGSSTCLRADAYCLNAISTGYNSKYDYCSSGNGLACLNLDQAKEVTCGATSSIKAELQLIADSKTVIKPLNNTLIYQISTYTSSTIAAKDFLSANCNSSLSYTDDSIELKNSCDTVSVFCVKTDVEAEGHHPYYYAVYVVMNKSYPNHAMLVYRKM